MEATKKNQPENGNPSLRCGNGGRSGGNTDKTVSASPPDLGKPLESGGLLSLKRKHLQFRDDTVSFVEADGPGFERFRIAVLFGLSGVTFVVTEKELFSWLEGPRIKSIRGSALILSPLARLLRPDQLLPLVSFPVFITRKEMLTLENEILLKGL